eukprot:259064-Pyramimonas_sp.AAC.1
METDCSSTAQLSNHNHITETKRSSDRPRRPIFLYSYVPMPIPYIPIPLRTAPSLLFIAARASLPSRLARSENVSGPHVSP